MNKTIKKLSFVFAFVLIFACTVFTGCSSNQISVVSIEKTSSSDAVDVYTITYSNGSTSVFTVTNGKNGQDATNITIQDIYEEYKNQYGEISYAEFLNLYLNFNVDSSQAINESLQSCLKIYSEYYVTTSSISSYFPYQITTKKDVSVECGSGVIYKITNDYVYVITNYHVVYNADANSDNGIKIARRIFGYLYGSEGEVSYDGSSYENGYPLYTYGDYALECEYIGGSVDYDIAVLRINKQSAFAINENIKAVTFANGYNVGETAYAIGNAENQGLSVTKGIVSVDNEYITLNIDGTNRQYRSIRMDTAIYGGNSGGGLFNKNGELIGIANAGDTSDQNINYAIPLDIVKNVTENIADYFDGTNVSSIKKLDFGMEVSSSNSKYVYDSSTGYGHIVETITISQVNENSVASMLGLQTNDILESIIINGDEISINRDFEIDDISIMIRTNDVISIKYTRNLETGLITSEYTVKYEDLA